MIWPVRFGSGDFALRLQGVRKRGEEGFLAPLEMTAWPPVGNDAAGRESFWFGVWFG